MEIASTNRMQQPSEFTVSANFELPMDLIIDILLRLPVTTLIRFKSVSKTLHTIIENPNFIKKHQTKLYQNPDYNPTLSSVFVISHDSETEHYSMWLQFRDKTCPPNPNPNPNPNFVFESYPCILAISNGLVAANFGGSEPIICNPTTGTVRKTSRFSLPEIESQSVFFGFGFQDNEYKLFRIVHSVTHSKAFVGGEVFSMRTDNWTEIKVNATMKFTYQGIECCGFFDLTPVSIKEVFYWKARSVEAKCVVSFDMNGYVFGRIDFPISLEVITSKTHWKLVDMKGELALTICRNTDWFEMWVMNETERSWTMKLRVGDLPSIGESLKVLGCERNGDLVMQHNNTPELERRLFSYVVKSQNIVSLPFPAIRRNHNVFLYTESLLLV